MRTLLAALAALALIAPAAAEAHPLGNFSVNHLAEVSVSGDRVDVRYILDAAEIPTLQGNVAVELDKLALTVDGKRVALRERARRSANPPGQGGLKTTRTVIDLSAAADDPHRVELRDGTFPGRVGWKAVLRKGDPDPTNGLTRYPDDLLESPADVRTATLTVGDGFEGILADGDRVLILLLLAAFGWGAVHALSPGHGKAMVAAYLVGTRGRPRHAIALGGIVTATHTAGVFALGLITLVLSQYVLPEDLYPYLNLAAGLLVVAVGVTVLRRQLRKRHEHGHHEHHHHDHHHHHDTKGLLAMGAAAGLIPCPSALVVLLGAISQDQVALGMLLIVAFSAGLAATLTALGLAVVWARNLPLPGRVMRVLPAASAALIVIVGCVLTANAVPTLTA